MALAHVSWLLAALSALLPGIWMAWLTAGTATRPAALFAALTASVFPLIAGAFFTDSSFIASTLDDYLVKGIAHLFGFALWAAGLGTELAIFLG